MKKEILHGIVWKRFIRMPYGHLLDYADENGNAEIPTPEECENSVPNPMGWWTPIENGAFFGGLYVYALIDGYSRNPDEKTAESIRTLIHGLKHLQDVGKTEGFIARGVASDGVAHYKCSSEDQVFPWVLGMYAYYKCPLCEDREDIRKRLLIVIDAIWPKDIHKPMVRIDECVERGKHNTTSQRAICSMLYCSYLRSILTGRKADMLHYEALRDGCPEGFPFTRMEIVSRGFASEMVRNISLIQFWIDVSFHIAIYELSDLDREKGDIYRLACRHNGYTALQFADDLLKYDNSHEGFGMNWRFISPTAIPFTGDRKEAVRHALSQSDIWSKNIVPHRHMEHSVLGNAIYGLWIALMCHDTNVERIAGKKLNDYIDRVDWHSLHLCYAYVAESCMILAEKIK